MLRKDLHGDDWRSFHRRRRELVQRRESVRLSLSLSSDPASFTAEAHSLGGKDAAALVAWERIQEQDREDVKHEIRNSRRNECVGVPSGVDRLAD